MYNFPHQVTNLDQTVAVAGNFVDDVNWHALVEAARMRGKG